MKKFTYTLAALAVAFSVNAYAQEELEIELEDTTEEAEMITETTPVEVTEKAKPNISNEEIEKTGKTLLKETDPIPKPEENKNTEENSPAKNEDKGSEAESEDEIEILDESLEEERITAETPRSVTDAIKPNISDETIAAAGKELKTGDFNVPDEVIVKQKTQTVLAVGGTTTATAASTSVALSNVSGRLGNLRSSRGTANHTASLGTMLATATEKSGLWVNSKYARINQRNQSKVNTWGISLGYDQPLQTLNGTLRVGAALDFDRNKGEIGTDKLVNNAYGLTLYSSYETPSDHYFDLLVRVGRSSVALTDAEKYNNTVYSTAFAYSHLFLLPNNLSLEPKAQLTYSHISASNFKKNRLPVYVKPINSLIATAGAKINYSLASQKFDIYGKVELNKEFLARSTGSVGVTKFDTEGKGTRATLGLGVKSHISKDASLYVDVDNYVGNGYRNSYQFNLGFNMKF
ncbi:autotransporter domain-containing protein [[Haemophilus] felis]|nr:autotransporter domain-containing protein [[Haemophilus] felis]